MRREELIVDQHSANQYSTNRPAKESYVAPLWFARVSCRVAYTQGALRGQQQQKEMYGRQAYVIVKIHITRWEKTKEKKVNAPEKAVINKKTTLKNNVKYYITVLTHFV